MPEALPRRAHPFRPVQDGPPLHDKQDQRDNSHYDRQRDQQNHGEYDIEQSFPKRMPDSFGAILILLQNQIRIGDIRKAYRLCAKLAPAPITMDGHPGIPIILPA